LAFGEEKKRHVGIISNVCKDVRRAVCRKKIIFLKPVKKKVYKKKLFFVDEKLWL